MKIRVVVLVFLISAFACSTASAGVYLGWKSYSDFCEDFDSKSKGAMALGLDYRMGLLRFVKLGVGLEYIWGDIDCDDTSFKQLGARAEAVLPVFSPSITEFYVGGGLSYNWFWDVSLEDCDALSGRTGIHGLAGVKIAPPILPVWGTIEGRYEWLSGEPGMTVSGIYLGVGLGL